LCSITIVGGVIGVPAEVDRIGEVGSSTETDSRKQSAGQQLIGDCGSACGHDCAFEDDGKATIRFEPFDRLEEECSDEDDRRDMKRS
jgi:hypothetical protein